MTRVTLPRLGRAVSRMKAGIMAKIKVDNLPIYHLEINPSLNGPCTYDFVCLNFEFVVTECTGNTYVFNAPALWAGMCDFNVDRIFAFIKRGGYLNGL